MAAQEKKGFFKRLTSRWRRSDDDGDAAANEPVAILDGESGDTAPGALKTSDGKDVTEKVSQATLIEKVMPLMEAKSKRFRKTRQVHARAAKNREKVVTITADGVETKNVAKPGDMVVKNLTGAQELYIISSKSFPRLYVLNDDLEDGWALYDPKGEVLAVEVSKKLMRDLGVNAEFFIEAPWGSDERVRSGDFLVSPFPTLKKIYRIARREFEQTYSPA